MSNRPKPTALKILQGNPGKRPLNDAEPKPEAGAPEMPWGLSSGARREFKIIVPMLVQMGLMSKVDKVAIAMYCEAYATWEKAERLKRKYGLIYESHFTDKDGNILMGDMKENPAVNISFKAGKQAKTFLVEFGLTPASRAKLKVEKAQAEDPLDAAMRKTSSEEAVEPAVDLADIDEDVVIN